MKQTSRVVLLATLSVAGGVVMAGPMIYSEFPGWPALIRLQVGVICGGLGTPMFAAAAWRKPVARAAASVFVPPTAAAVLAALAWSDDYSFTHIAVPLSWVTALLMFFVLPDRVPAADGRCPDCGYDLRALPGGRCPECGGMPPEPPAASTRRRRYTLHVVVLLVATALSVGLQEVVIRGVLSLG